eukprot:s1043_g24.t2
MTCFHGPLEQQFSLEFRCTVLVQQLSIAGGCRGTVLASQHCCLEILLSQIVGLLDSFPLVLEAEVEQYCMSRAGDRTRYN